jgi:hypothetical protein
MCLCHSLSFNVEDCTTVDITNILLCGRHKKESIIIPWHPLFFPPFRMHIPNLLLPIRLVPSHFRQSYHIQTRLISHKSGNISYNNNSHLARFSTFNNLLIEIILCSVLSAEALTPHTQHLFLPKMNICLAIIDQQIELAYYFYTLLDSSNFFLLTLERRKSLSRGLSSTFACKMSNFDGNLT